MQLLTSFWFAASLRRVLVRVRHSLQGSLTSMGLDLAGLGPKLDVDAELWLWDPP